MRWFGPLREVHLIDISPVYLGSGEQPATVSAVEKQPQILSVSRCSVNNPGVGRIVADHPDMVSWAELAPVRRSARIVWLGLASGLLPPRLCRCRIQLGLRF